MNIHTHSRKFEKCNNLLCFHIKHVVIVCGLHQHPVRHLGQMVVRGVAQHDAEQAVCLPCSTSTGRTLDVVRHDPAGPVRGVTDGVVLGEGIIFKHQQMFAALRLEQYQRLIVQDERFGLLAEPSSGWWRRGRGQRGNRRGRCR